MRSQIGCSLCSFKLFLKYALAKRRLTAIGAVIEGKMEGNKAKKPRQIMLDWMLADSYRKLKDETQHRTRGLAIDAYI